MKREVRLLPGLLVALLVALSACVALPSAGRAPAAQVEVTPSAAVAAASSATPASQVPAEDDSGAPVDSGAPADPLTPCPAPTDTLQRLVVPQGRYCLAYPAEYKVEKPGPQETLLVVGGLLDASNPRVQIDVADAAGATADTAADRIVSDFKDFKLDRSVRTVAGEPAVLLDKVPGQEIGRKVLFVKDGLLYDLTFAPADPAGPAFKRMEQLQNQVLESFTFLPAGLSVADDCLSSTGGAQLHRDAARGFCLLYPAGYRAEQTDATETVFYAGSPADVSKPKLFVRVEDANGRSAKEMADSIAADIEKALPGHSLDRPFGVTLGYEPAERLDNVPGQDIGRMLIVVHGRRAYRLAFVPADPADTALFGQTETLYDLVLRSFRFTD